MNPNQVEQNNHPVLNNQMVQEQQVQVQQQAVPQGQMPIQQAPVAGNPVPKKNIKKPKKSNKTLIIVFLVVIVIVAGYFLLNGGKFKGNKILGGSTGNGEKIEVETGQKWGDKFASYFQDFYAELIYDEDEEKAQYKASIDREFEVLFADFDFDGTPEMVVRYKDDADVRTIRIFQYRSGDVNETKDFRNSSFKIVYSLKDKTSAWYIFISANNNKYGAYTSLEKILAGKAYDSDIKANNDKEMSKFNNNYATMEYKYIFYEIDDESFADDFKLAVSKYSDKEVNEIRTKLYEEYHDVEPAEDELIHPYSNLEVGEFTLEFGRYVARIPKYENGEEAGFEDKYVTINRNYTITDGTNIIGYSVYGSIFSLDTGISFKVTDNNKFTYGSGEGFDYELVE